jgi:hypothetical protein
MHFSGGDGRVSVLRIQLFYTCLLYSYVASRGVDCMDVGEALLPYGNATNIFLQISRNFSYFKILINLRTYITYNENNASFNVLHKQFIRKYQLFSCWILA